MWKVITSTTNFTKKHKTGHLFTLFVVIICCALPFVSPLLVREKKYDHSNFEKEIAALNIKQSDPTSSYSVNNGDEYPQYNQPDEKRYMSATTKGELFYFDPNTLSEDGWKRLGLRDKTITTIKNYLAKGGKFKNPTDIGKIWGMSKTDAERLMPYVKLPDDQQNKNYTGAVISKQPTAANAEKKIYTVLMVDINTADTSALIALPGIGSKLSQRIINFRDKLGGFYKVEQVAETFGLPDSTFQKIKDKLVLNNASLKKININTATIDELKSHPYLRYAIANAIVQYRNQHGNFSSLADLKKVMAVTDDVYSKALPYLTTD